MGTFKRMLKLLFAFFILYLVGNGLIIFSSYNKVSTIVESKFGELSYQVIEDNCLDNTIVYANGKTDYMNFKYRLERLEESSGFIEFDDNSLYVQYTSRDTAPQKGEPINIRLTGYMRYTLPIFGGLPVRVPVEYETTVYGIKYYRDR